MNPIGERVCSFAPQSFAQHNVSPIHQVHSQLSDFTLLFHFEFGIEKRLNVLSLYYLFFQKKKQQQKNNNTTVSAIL